MTETYFLPIYCSAREIPLADFIRYLFLKSDVIDKNT